MSNLRSKLSEEQLHFLNDLHAQLMGQDLLERPSPAYALKGLLCELTKTGFMAPSYICEKLNLLFSDVEFSYKYRGE